MINSKVAQRWQPSNFQSAVKDLAALFLFFRIPPCLCHYGLTFYFEIKSNIMSGRRASRKGAVDAEDAKLLLADTN
jgi:hypothetical protein